MEDSELHAILMREGCGGRMPPRGCGGATRLHAAFKPPPPLRRPTSPTNQIAVRGIMRLPTQQKRADARIRPGLCGLSRAMTCPPGRRSAPKHSIQDRKGHSCDGRTLFQGGRFGIQGLPLERIGGLLSPSRDLVCGKPHIGFGILPVHRAESFYLFLPSTCLFPCEPAVIFGRPWFLCLLGRRHLLWGHKMPPPPSI
jgi:hypothetical protein